MVAYLAERPELRRLKLLKIVEYVVIFDEGVRKRHYHETEHGQVAKFVVQLEVLQEKRWTPVVRYDCAHSFAHIDRFFSFNSLDSFTKFGIVPNAPQKSPKNW